MTGPSTLSTASTTSTVAELVLLDTHVWIWSVQGDTRRLGRQTRRLLARAESGGNIRISPATLFELTALHTLGRLRLTRTPEQWIRESLNASGVRIAELSAAIAIDAGTIPRTALADPLDRLLLATARQLHAVFLTSDTRILDYASEHGGVLVRDAGL
jgi:PIN domain nuclease of toxin-antitoxin system